MTKYKCPNCGIVEDVHKELTRTTCEECGAKVGETSEEVIEEIRESDEYATGE